MMHVVGLSCVTTIGMVRELFILLYQISGGWCEVRSC
jgi:hypothetical protein